MRRSLTRLAVTASIPLAVLALSPSASADVVDGPNFDPGTAAPGATVVVKTTFGLPLGWTPDPNAPTVAVQLKVPDPSDAVFTLDATPSWANQCAVSDFTIACEWAPQFDSAQAELEVNLTVKPSAPAQTIAVEASTIVPGFDTAAVTAPLLVTLTPTISPTATPTPTGTATPTPTSSAAPTSAAVPTAVPAGAGPLDPPSGGLRAGWLALIAAAGIAVAGSASLARRGRRQV